MIPDKVRTLLELADELLCSAADAAANEKDLKTQGRIMEVQMELDKLTSPSPDDDEDKDEIEDDGDDDPDEDSEEEDDGFIEEEDVDEEDLEKSDDPWE